MTTVQDFTAEHKRLPKDVYTTTYENWHFCPECQNVLYIKTNVKTRKVTYICLTVACSFKEIEYTAHKITTHKMLLSSASQPDVRDFKASEYPSKTRKNRCASYDYCGTKTAQDIQNLHLDELIAIGKARDQQNEMSGVGEEGVRSREGSQEVVVAEMWRDGRERRSLSLVSAGREREESVPVHDAVRVVKVEVDSEEEL